MFSRGRALQPKIDFNAIVVAGKKSGTQRPGGSMRCKTELE